MQKNEFLIIRFLHNSRYNFHFSCFLIIFADTLQDFNLFHYTGRIIHILCCQGNRGFTIQDTRYNIAAADYVILPNATLVSGFSESDDFPGILMSLSDAFVTPITMQSNYGITGRLSLLQNPVLKLSSYDFQICREAMQYIRKRIENNLDFYASRLCITPHYLAEIAARLNFSSVSYFSRYVQKRIKVTPSEYRNKSSRHL